MEANYHDAMEPFSAYRGEDCIGHRAEIDVVENRGLRIDPWTHRYADAVSEQLIRERN